MKELSIEEKAKRYDEAIEQLRTMMPNWESLSYNGKTFLQDLVHIIPELKESEDDRIRKAIGYAIGQSTHSDGILINGVSYEEALAWLERQGNLMKALQISNAEIGELIEKNYYLREQLEKQGKNNMGISEATKQKLEDNLNKALEQETPESWNKFLDEQSEQKPVFEMKTPEESLGIDSDTYNKIVDECVYGEQNLDWSEEDEERFESCIKVLQTSDGYDTINVKWLKSLKGRVQLQQKQEWKQENTGDLTDFENAMMHIGGSFFGDNAGLDPNDTNVIKEQAILLLELIPSKEWSEEDNRMCKAIIDNIQAICEEGYFVGNIDSDELIKWLKSIKERYTWRPSDEQMDALHYVTNFDYGGHKATLVSLYEQLKKLKG